MSFDRRVAELGLVLHGPHPTVIDGASRVLFDVFGEQGRHTRSAIGVAALPRGGAVELELTAAVRT